MPSPFFMGGRPVRRLLCFSVFNSGTSRLLLSKDLSEFQSKTTHHYRDRLNLILTYNVDYH